MARVYSFVIMFLLPYGTTLASICPFSTFSLGSVPLTDDLLTLCDRILPFSFDQLVSQVKTFFPPDFTHLKHVTMLDKFAQPFWCPLYV